MTTLLRRNFNLKSLCRWRLYFNTIHKEFNSSRPAIPYMKNNHINGSKYFASAVPQFKMNDDSGNKENPETLVSEASSLKTIDKALEDLNYLVQRTGRTVRKTVESILSMIENQGFVSKTHGLYLLRTCSLMWSENPMQRVEFVDQIWRKLQDLGCPLELGHFNSLLKVYVENNHSFSPSEFLAKMESHKIEPNKVTFLFLLDKYASDGNISGASEVLQFMKDKGLPINETVFNILIKGHMKAKDPSGARDVLEVMRSSYLPSADTYTALACGYAEQGEIEEVKLIFKEAKSNNISLTTANCLSIISSLPAEQSTFVDTILEMLDDIHIWRQEVINCMLGLIHKDLDHTAYKLLLAISSGEESHNSTNHFVKQLIKAEKPVEKIIDYCDKIDAQHLNEYIFINAARAAIEYEKFDHALALFDELHKRGIPVRVTHFFNMFDHHKNSLEGIWSTLKKMHELGVPPDFMTFEKYVFPAISLTNPQEVITKLQETGLSLMSVIDPLFQYYCNHGDVENALYLIENYPVRIYTTFNLEKFLSMHNRLRFDSNVVCKLLSYVLRKNQMIPGKEAEVLQGKQLALLIQKNPALFQTWLKRSNEEKEKCKFSQLTLETCWSILRDKAPERLVYLKAFERNQPQITIAKTAEEEEKQLNLLKEKGISTEQYLIESLYQHIQEKNIDRVSKVRAELDELGVIYPPVVYAHLLTLYCNASDLEAATDSLHILKDKYPDFNVESIKVLNYASLLVRFSKFEEAKKIIQNECQELHIFGNPEFLLRAIKRLFYAAIETGDCDLVKSIQDSLMHHSKEFSPDIFIYESLMRLHIHRNDLHSAVDEFRNCVMNHKVVPALNAILKKCIIADDQQNLKTVISLASGLVPEHKVLRELAMSFFDTGRKQQAANVMERIDRKASPVYIEEICTRLYNQKRVIELENLLRTVEKHEHLGQESLFYNLFKLYDERNDCKKALELYKRIEKAKIFDPSDRIKNLLSKLLTRNGQSVSFPEMKTSASVNAQHTPDTEEFFKCINKEDVFQALKKLQNMKKGDIQSISQNEMSKFVDLLVRDKCTNDASHNVQFMSYIIENANSIIKPLLEKYSTNGDVESLKGLANFLPDFTMKKLFFNTYYAKAHLSSGKFEDLLIELETNQSNNSNKLFSLSAFEGLLKFSNQEERLVKLAKGYLDANFHLPIGIVWAHYITNENYDKAKELFKLHSIPVDKVDSMILKVVRQDNNITMGKEYIDAINQQNVKSRFKERAYGTLLDVLVLKNYNEDAIALLAEAKQREINLEKYYRSTLITLKNALERENKEVPFTIPSEEFVVSG